MTINRLTTEERKAIVVVCKSGWFLLATLGKFITTTSSYTLEAIKAAEVVGDQLDSYLKEIR